MGSHSTGEDRHRTQKRDALQKSGISMIMDVCSRLRSMPSIPDGCPQSNGWVHVAIRRTLAR